MTVAEFTAKLGSKFPELLSAKGSPELDDIEDFLDGIDPADLGKLWDEFRDTYTFSTAPRRAVFVKAAQSSGVRRKRPCQANLEWVCYVCGARFALNVPQALCPGCHNRDWSKQALIRIGAERRRPLVREELEAIDAYKAGKRG